MVMNFILIPWSHYNTIIKPFACFIYSFLEGLSIDFHSNMILSILDTFRDTANHDKLIVPSFIMHRLMHVCVFNPFSTLFPFVGAISKEFLVRRYLLLIAKTKRP